MAKEMVFTGGNWIDQEAGGRWRLADHRRPLSRVPAARIATSWHRSPPCDCDSGSTTPESGIVSGAKTLASWSPIDSWNFGSNQIDDMPDVDFRLTDRGQAEITVDGSDYVMQIYPPTLAGNEAPPQRMVAELNLAGVDMGVLQCDHVYGDLNDYFAQAMQDYPGRFIGLSQIWEPEADNPERLRNVEEGVRQIR